MIQTAALSESFDYLRAAVAIHAHASTSSDIDNSRVRMRCGKKLDEKTSRVRTVTEHLHRRCIVPM